MPRPLINENLKKLWIKQIKKMLKKGYTQDGLAKIYGPWLVLSAITGKDIEELMPGQQLTAQSSPDGSSSADIKELPEAGEKVVGE